MINSREVFLCSTGVNGLVAAGHDGGVVVMIEYCLGAILINRGGFRDYRSIRISDIDVLPDGEFLAVRRVPRVTTSGPWQVIGERGEEVTQGPGNNDVVVKIHVKSN